MKLLKRLSLTLDADNIEIAPPRCKPQPPVTYRESWRYFGKLVALWEQASDSHSPVNYRQIK